MSPEEPSRRLRAGLVAVGAAIALVLVVAIVVANAPANWLARAVADRTGGRLLLADAQGTVWSGSAILAFGTPTPGGTGPAPGLALPGRVTWTLDFAGFLAPVIQVTQDAVLRQPVAVRYRDGEVEIGPGTATLPASMLQVLGSPLNTLRPDGQVEAAWESLRWNRQGVLTGAGSARVSSLSVAVSPVRPLGSYRVQWISDAQGLAWTLSTERGPLDLSGSGRVGRPSQVQVIARAAADAPPALVARLGPLLDAIGRRSPTEAVYGTGR